MYITSPFTERRRDRSLNSEFKCWKFDLFESIIDSLDKLPHLRDNPKIWRRFYFVEEQKLG